MTNSGVLVLNRNWMAIHVCTVPRSISLLVQGLAQVVTEDYRTYSFESWRELSLHVQSEGNRFIHSPSVRLMVPEVILLTRFHRVPPRMVKFNRRNIYIRDQMTCQYCGRKPAREDLTIDHVVPKSRGGRSEWENVVLACQACNARKGSHLLGEIHHIALLRKPRKPHWVSIIRHTLKGQERPIWQKFVDAAYWNVDLEEG
ncbi:HNH endonuclease [Candidatus Poribacteria bacterium]|nr:HNH endonuclease [Candidatus Poribacteria bacterium]